MKYLVVAGCSNTYGSETIGDYDHSPESINYAYGFHIAKHLNLQYINIAVPGISNVEIAYRIFDWVKNNNNILDKTVFVVGWTGIGRVRLDIEAPCCTLTPGTMWLYTHNNTTDPCFASQCKDTCKIIDPDNTFFKTYLKFFAETSDVFLKDLLCRLSVDLLFQKHKMYYLTFLCDHNIKPLWYTINRQFRPFFSEKNNIFDYSIINKCGNKRGVAKGGHMNKKAHIEAAKIIMDELYKRKIINTVAFSSKFLYK